MLSGSGIDAWRVRSLMENVISVLRGGACEVKISGIERKESGYVVEGSYVLTKYVMFEGRKVLEEGTFTAELSEDFNLLGIKVSPSRRAGEELGGVGRRPAYA